MNRLHTLDYLRGLTALGIMVYHYSTSIYGEFLANTFLGRIGVYGVSIFYILSGLTLFHVYYEKMKPSKNDILLFLQKRILRIFPLLWVVTIFSVFLSREMPNYLDLFLNLTGLFGFIHWDKYFSAGVWSIGNEIVFYTFFPIFVFISKKLQLLLFPLFLFLLGLYLSFSFHILNNNLTLSEQWKNYVNPLNQVFLFLAGFIIGAYSTKYTIKNRHIFLVLLLAILLFMLYPVSGNTINLVTGLNRVVLTFLSCLICFCFYKLQYTLPKRLNIIFITLGIISYSVYLLHPIVWSVISKFVRILSLKGFTLNGTSVICISILVTLITSFFSYHKFETLFIKISKISLNRSKI